MNPDSTTYANISNYLIHRRESIETDIMTWRFANTMPDEFHVAIQRSDIDPTRIDVKQANITETPRKQGDNS